ncbi:MAG: hypothetical protein ACFFDW_06630, partial [Candidatus Thorarchaeota archaeon]
KLLTNFRLNIMNFLKQKISYKLVLETLYYFIEDLEPEFIDLEELIEDLMRYLLLSPDEISMPIHIREKALEIIENLIENGYQTSFSKIAEYMDIDNSLITREIAKINARYNAFWRVEKNFNKMGLYTYLIIIRFDNKDEIYDLLIKKIGEIKYTFDIFTGSNEKYVYLYTILQSPHLLINNLIYEFDKLVKEKKIISFDINTITKRSFYSSFVQQALNPSIENIQNLLENKILYKKLELWNTDLFNDKKRIDFKTQNEKLLEFLSVLLYSHLTGNKIFGVRIEHIYKFFEKHNINPKDMVLITNFMTNLEKEAIDMNLLDYRLQVAKSRLNTSNSLIIKLIKPPERNDIEKIINSLLCFGISIVMESYDCIFISIIGPTNDCLVYKSVHQFLNKSKIPFECFIIESIIRKYVPYHILYDYENKKWLI